MVHPSIDRNLIINTAEGGAIVRLQGAHGPTTEAIDVAGTVQGIESSGRRRGPRTNGTYRPSRWCWRCRSLWVHDTADRLVIVH